jgi:hypothetical protein
MSVLTVESINSIFNQLLPLIEPYSQYMFWKYDQYELLYRVAKLVKSKAHFTLYGFLTIIDIIYSYPNKRHQSKEFWINIIKSKFKKIVEKNISRNNNIQAVYGRDNFREHIVAWKCVFPIESKIKSKQFGFYSAENKQQVNNSKPVIIKHSNIEALNLAIQYRDSSIKSWVDSIK